MISEEVILAIIIIYQNNECINYNFQNPIELIVHIWWISQDSSIIRVSVWICICCFKQLMSREYKLYEYNWQVHLGLAGQFMHEY